MGEERAVVAAAFEEEKVGVVGGKAGVVEGKAVVVGGNTAVEGDKAVGDKMQGGGVVAGAGEESTAAVAEEGGDGTDVVDTARDLN